MGNGETDGPTFQLGYKGYIQLAMRTGQYQTKCRCCFFEDEFKTKKN
jgi:recombinational DNA repair protein RecT